MQDFYGRGSGWVEVVCGCMFSGKTEELIRRVKRAEIGRQKVQIFKPQIDDRYGRDFVATHDATKVPSVPVAAASEILGLIEDTTRVVGIDEAQFFDESIVDVCLRLANRGLRVIVAGLDMDYRGIPFGPMPALLAVAEQVTKLTAVCMVCGAPATRTQRFSPIEEQVLVGAQDHYEARCREHHHAIEATTTVRPRRRNDERASASAVNPKASVVETGAPVSVKSKNPFLDDLT